MAGNRPNCDSPVGGLFSELPRRQSTGTESNGELDRRYTTPALPTRSSFAALERRKTICSGELLRSRPVGTYRRSLFGEVSQKDISDFKAMAKEHELRKAAEFAAKWGFDVTQGRPVESRFDYTRVDPTEEVASVPSALKINLENQCPNSPSLSAAEVSLEKIATPLSLSANEVHSPSKSLVSKQLSMNVHERIPSSGKCRRRLFDEEGDGVNAEATTTSQLSFRPRRSSEVSMNCGRPRLLSEVSVCEMPTPKRRRTFDHLLGSVVDSSPSVPACKVHPAMDFEETGEDSCVSME